MDDTLIIGDTHGHLDRIERLLRQEGLIDKEGRRAKPEIELVHLGDLCHLGHETAREDQLTMEAAPAWFDVILYGNHDYAAMNRNHHFGGYRFSSYGGGGSFPDLSWYQNRYLDLQHAGKLRLAHEAHGFLLTHAGLHPKILDRALSARQASDWLNNEVLPSDNKNPARDAISFGRGGTHFYGGVLWRDASEDLCFAFPQIFGHTAFPHEVRKYKPDHGDRDTFTSYCIDIGNKGATGKLAGIYLPSEKIVEIDTADTVADTADA